jgi:hypothetical protein
MYGVQTVFLAGKSPYIRSYTVQIAVQANPTKTTSFFSDTPASSKPKQKRVGRILTFMLKKTESILSELFVFFALHLGSIICIPTYFIDKWHNFLPYLLLGSTGCARV